MDLDNQLPILLISLYLIFIYLIMTFKYKKFKKNHKKNKINLNNYDKTMLLYINNESTLKELFFESFLKLQKNKFKDNNLLSYEIIVYNYAKKLDDKFISIEKLEEIINNDLTFYQIQTSFFKKLKMETKKRIGQIDFVSENILAIIISFPYFIGALYSIYNDFSNKNLILLATLLSLINLVIINKIKYKTFTWKTFIKYNIVALISSYVWIRYSNVNYIIFHVILSYFSFMYPLLIYIIKYSIKINTNFINEKQSVIIKELLTNVDI